MSEKKVPFKIAAINISEEKGKKKKPIPSATLVAAHGIQGDAHAGLWHRQVSLLGDEDVETIRGKGLDIGHGDFAENITTEGVHWNDLPVGTRIVMGEAELEMTQIGKKCHQHCEIFKTVGDCVMPRCGVFAKVLKGGEISPKTECHYLAAD